MYRSVLSAGVILVLLPGAAQAAPFQNLDFEHVTWPPLEGELVIQGWNTWPAPPVYNEWPLGSTLVTVVGQGPGLGGYMVYLHSHLTYDYPDNIYPSNAFIWQVGEVPRGAQRLSFLTDDPSYHSPYTQQELAVSLDGARIPLIEVFAPDHVRTLAGDVSEFAGRTVELRFELFNYNLGFPCYAAIDAITFEPIPEPSSLSVWALLGALGIGLGWWRSRRRA